MREGKPCIREGVIGHFFSMVVLWSFQHEKWRGLAEVEAEAESCASALEQIELVWAWVEQWSSLHAQCSDSARVLAELELR